MSIAVHTFQNIIILTGACVSVASGIRPFRGANGVWNDSNAERLSSIETLKSDPESVWRFWREVRKIVLESQPNSAHIALSKLESTLHPDQNFLLITQNVDGFHTKAGSVNVAELHGNVLKSKCSNDACKIEPFKDHCVTGAPRCPLCGCYLRPDIVLFGENLPLEAGWKAKKALRDCDLFIAVGTSGTVSPAADFVRGADYAGARTIYINAEPMSPPNPYFHETIIGKAEEVLPMLFV